MLKNFNNNNGFKHGFFFEKSFSQRKNPNFVTDFSSALKFSPVLLEFSRVEVNKNG